MPNTLFLGIGGHWKLHEPSGVTWGEAFNFGNIDLSYLWWTQGIIKIRPGKMYEGSGLPDEGRGRHLTWIQVHDDFGNYIDDPSQWRIRHGSLSSDGFDPSSDNPLFDVWIAKVRAEIEAELQDYHTATGRIQELDDETFHHGLLWGRRGQSYNCRHLRHGTNELIQAHNDLVMPFKAALINALKSDYPTDSFTWYNIPFTGNKQPPYDGGWWASSHQPPTRDDASADAEDIPQMLQCRGFIDGHTYLSNPNPPMQTTERRKGWFKGQIQRRRRLLAEAQALDPSTDISRILFKQWIYRDPRSVFIQEGSGAEIPYSTLIREWFEACVEEGVEDIAISTGKVQWEAYASSAGEDPGLFWRKHIEARAIEAGFLPASGGVFAPAALTVSGITPSSLPVDDTTTVTINGSGFNESTVPSISGDGITIDSVTLEGNSLIVEISVADDATLGLRDLVVTRGITSITLVNAINITNDVLGPAVDPLELTSVEPETIERDTIEAVTVTGTGFSSSLAFGTSNPGVTVLDVQVLGSTQAVVTLQVEPRAVLGSLNLTAVDDDETFTLPDALTVLPSDLLETEPLVGAERYDLTVANDDPIEQGTTLILPFQFFEDNAETIPVDLTGYTAAMQIRRDYDAESPVLTINTEGVAGDNIVIGDAEGKITVYMSDETTASLPGRFRGVYDIELYKDGTVQRFVFGDVEVTPEVTR